MSPLVWGGILGVFVNTLTAYGKYLVQDCENLEVPIQMQLSEKRKFFSEFFVAFLVSPSNFKDYIIVNVLHEWETAKNLVRPLSEKPHLRTPFVISMWKHPQYLLHQPERSFIIFLHHCEGSWFGKCLP